MQMVAGEAILSCPNAIKPLVSALYLAGGAAATLGVSAPPSGNAAPSSGCPLAPPLLGMSGIRIRRHILGNVLYSTFTSVFIIVTFFALLTVF